MIEPLSKARYKVQFTASAELRDKLERLRALMRSSVPDGDIGAIIEQAVTEKLERLEARRFGQVKNPRKSLEGTDTTPDSRSIPAAVKRAVCERDQNQCTFRDERGLRCTERRALEFHHKVPFKKGGDHSVNNVFLLCKTHNLHQAEIDYGKLMEQYRRQGELIYETAAVYRTVPNSIRAPDSSANRTWGAFMSGTSHESAYRSFDRTTVHAPKRPFVRYPYMHRAHRRGLPDFRRRCMPAGRAAIHLWVTCSTRQVQASTT